MDKTNPNQVAHNELLDAALGYADQGWAVLPLHNVENGRCSCDKSNCNSPAKHPRTLCGVKDATTDHSVISGWWRKWPNANVGIATGAISGIFVIDVDRDSGGYESLEKMKCELGPLPLGPTVSTGGGGVHLLFKHPGTPIRNRTSIRPGIDVRGDGGYIVAPPSNHMSGDSYEWNDSGGPDDA